MGMKFIKSTLVVVLLWNGCVLAVKRKHEFARLSSSLRQKQDSVTAEPIPDLNFPPPEDVRVVPPPQDSPPVKKTYYQMMIERRIKESVQK